MALKFKVEPLHALLILKLIISISIGFFCFYCYDPAAFERIDFFKILFLAGCIPLGISSYYSLLFYFTSKSIKKVEPLLIFLFSSCFADAMIISGIIRHFYGNEYGFVGSLARGFLGRPSNSLLYDIGLIGYYFTVFIGLIILLILIFKLIRRKVSK